MLTVEQKQAYRDKWDAEKKHRETIYAKLRAAKAAGDSDGLDAGMEELAMYDESLYPCEHGVGLWEDCWQCEEIEREVRGLPPDED